VEVDVDVAFVVDVKAEPNVDVENMAEEDFEVAELNVEVENMAEANFEVAVDVIVDVDVPVVDSRIMVGVFGPITVADPSVEID